MKYLNTYENMAAYNADTNRPANKNTVSYIKDTDNIVRNGVNVVVDPRYCSKGDTVVYDTEENRTKVIKFGTVKLPLPSKYVIVGTVYDRDERTVKVVANQYAGTARWGAPWLVKLSNLSPGSFTITVNSSVTGAIEYESTDTLSVLASRIAAAITSLGFTGWTAKAYDNYIVVQQDYYTPNIASFTVSDPGVSVEVLTGNYQTAISGLLNNNTQLFRIDKTVSYFAGCNYHKFIEYYSVNGSDITGESLTSANVIRRSRFNMQDNPLLVERFVTYENYISNKLVLYPYPKGMITDSDGKRNTSVLSAVKYAGHDGIESPAYPAAHNAGQYTVGVPGFSEGNWWLPSAPEMYILSKDITTGMSGMGDDILNTGIRAAGGAVISVATHRWTSSEYSGNFGWIYSGTNGSIYTNYKNYAYSVRPVSAFQIIEF